MKRACLALLVALLFSIIACVVLRPALEDRQSTSISYRLWKWGVAPFEKRFLRWVPHDPTAQRVFTGKSLDYFQSHTGLSLYDGAQTPSDSYKRMRLEEAVAQHGLSPKLYWLNEDLHKQSDWYVLTVDGLVVRVGLAKG